MDWLFAYADPSIDWNYAMVTLVVRFIGVFIVMAIVQVALQSASFVINRIESRADRKAATDAQEAPVTSLDISALAAHDAEFDGPAVAAIGLALALEAAQRTSRPGVGTAASGRTSAWAMAGRMRGMR